ncbi:elongation factor 1-beta-like protein [Gonapodya prolifera JEL478]|uniref:Elongation factor 1-beta-like protein n=1 Tax=Gonapodya prolifera (strain JEL478) TaxID=1344416 RepID=A0A139A3K6_GONPJ|nr:elongation factor 1-beta-like protein [Gonapodya prolifera JEL478]|eukprot:KXS11361.1 elongation factor 1-beta-like protein [Gonapodya prolifera JEL478]
MGFDKLPAAAGLQALNEWLELRSYIDGWTATQADVAVFAAVGKAPDDAKYPHAWRWYHHIAHLGESKSTLPGTKKAASAYGPNPVANGAAAPAAAAAKAAPAEEEEEEEIDLFGDDEEVDEEAERIKAQRIKEYEDKKKTKVAVIAKSSILLDVKPWDDETDMKELETAVRAIEMDGLVWGASKLVPVGFGIKKLQISCVVEDDKVGMDDLTDKIQEDEDHVQSVDVAAFNKI